MKAWVACDMDDEGNVYPIGVILDEEKSKDSFHVVEVEVWE